MNEQTPSINQLADLARRKVREASPWIERLGRAGYAAKGIVYVLVGWLAASAAAGKGGRISDQHGALRWIKGAPFGKILLITIAVGLTGYAIWRLIQAVKDTERKGTDARGIVVRVGYFVIGLIYAALSYSALQIAMGVRGNGGDRTQRSWTAWLLAQPFGPLLVGLTGLSVIGVGLYQFYKAYTADFGERLEHKKMSRDQEKWMIRIGRFGLAARGVIFGLIGGYLIAASVQSDPRQTRGLGGALRALAEQPYGQWMLGITAAGLIAYGIFFMMLARYRRIVIS